MTLICAHCKNIFNRKPSEISNINFCSRKCFNNYRKSNNKGKFVKCSVCTKIHYRTPTNLKKDRYFCSRECFYNYMLSLKGEKAPNYKNRLLHKKCVVCYKEFETYLKNQNCCSKKCGYASQRKKVELKCTYCAKSFETQASKKYWHDKRGCTNFFCSMKCKKIYHVGENHPKYIVNRSKIKNVDKSIRWSKDMVLWRKSVYTRDNYMCQICGDNSSKNNKVVLNAHHIKRFNDYKLLRFDVNNGITLCELCHKLTYRKETKFEKQFMDNINEEKIQIS